MTLNADEYHAHLKRGASRAGIAIADHVLPERRETTINSLRFSYLEWPGPRSPSMVFLHGGGLNAHTWDLCCSVLSKAFHCVSLDQRGHGESDWAKDEDYSIASQRGDVEGFVDYLKLDHFILVGMSMGAINALAYAIEHSVRLSALVLIDSGPNLPREGSRRIREFVTQGTGYPSIEAAVEHALSFNPRRSAESLRVSLKQSLRQMPDGTWRRKDDSKRYDPAKQEARIGDRLKLRDGLSRVSCPVLVVRGGESDVFFEEDAQALAASFRHGQRVTIPKAGHTVQGDNPKALVDAIQIFLDKAGLLPEKTS